MEHVSSSDLTNLRSYIKHPFEKYKSQSIIDSLCNTTLEKLLWKYYFLYLSMDHWFMVSFLYVEKCSYALQIISLYASWIIPSGWLPLRFYLWFLLAAQGQQAFPIRYYPQPERQILFVSRPCFCFNEWGRCFYQRQYR